MAEWSTWPLDGGNHGLFASHCLDSHETLFVAVNLRPRHPTLVADAVAPGTVVYLPGQSKRPQDHATAIKALCAPMAQSPCGPSSF